MKIRNLITAFFPVLIPFLGIAQQHYEVIVNINNVKPKSKVYLNYMVDQHVFEDSASLEGRHFVFRGFQATPVKAYVILKHSGNSIKNDSNEDKVGIYLENGIVTVNAVDSLKNGTVTGTPLNVDQQQVSELLTRYAHQKEAMLSAYDNAEGKLVLQEKIKADYALLEKQKNDAIGAFVKSHANSLVSLNLLLTNVDPAKDVYAARYLFETLSKQLKESFNGKAYKNALSLAQNVDVGAQAPEFELKNSRNEKVGLSAYKGKYVLIDFWASWCAPCRTENLNLISCYNKFKNKKFVIIGISLDAGEIGKEQWMQAISKDQIPWEQVTDLMGWQSPVVKSYEIRTIPANYLIDPSGKIIAKNIKSQQLGEKLKELL